MSDKFLILIVTGVTVFCGLLVLCLAVSAPDPAQFFERAFNSTLSLFTLGVGAIFGLLGNGKLARKEKNHPNNVTAVDGNKLTIRVDHAGEKRVVDSFVERV